MDTSNLKTNIYSHATKTGLGTDLHSVLSDVREVFDLFDFWDGRDGLVDAAKVGDLLRCIGLNPTNALIKRHGGTEKFGMSHKSKNNDQLLFRVQMRFIWN